MTKQREIDAHTLANRLQSALILLVRAMREKDRSSELTSAQRSVLSRLINHGPHTLGDLANAEKVRPPSMTRTIQQLERAGYIIRKPTQDKRVSKVDYTSKAWSTLEKTKTRRASHLAQSIQNLTAKEQQSVLAAIPILEKLAHPN